MTSSKRRILIGKAGLDGHDRGARIIARALRDAGNEIIYTGLHQTPESIVRTAIDEDVDAIGISILSGAHMYIFPEIVKLLKQEKASEIVVFGGGIIPDADIEELYKKGIAKLFTPGATTSEIADWVEEKVPMLRNAV